MKKTKYRYKCMICGTEVVSADDVLSCSACGSDELAKFEIAPIIDVIEKKLPRKPPHHRKSASSLTSDVDILSFGDFDPAPPMPASIPPYKRPSIHISSPPSPTKWECIRSFIAKAPWRVLLRITVPLAIGGAIYGIVKLFI